MRAEASMAPRSAAAGAAHALPSSEGVAADALASAAPIVCAAAIVVCMRPMAAAVRPIADAPSIVREAVLASCAAALAASAAAPPTLATLSALPDAAAFVDDPASTAAAVWAAAIEDARR